jgi:hypothetical protein
LTRNFTSFDIGTDSGKTYLALNNNTFPKGRIQFANLATVNGSPQNYAEARITSRSVFARSSRAIDERDEAENIPKSAEIATNQASEAAAAGSTVASTLLDYTGSPASDTSLEGLQDVVPTSQNEEGHFGKKGDSSSQDSTSNKSPASADSPSWTNIITAMFIIALLILLSCLARACIRRLQKRRRDSLEDEYWAKMEPGPQRPQYAGPA